MLLPGSLEICKVRGSGLCGEPGLMARVFHDEIELGTCITGAASGQSSGLCKYAATAIEYRR